MDLHLGVGQLRVAFDEVVRCRRQIFKVTHGYVTFSTCHALDCSVYVLNGSDELICMGDGGIGDMFVLKEDGVGHSFCIHLLDLVDMGMVVVGGGI